MKTTIDLADELAAALKKRTARDGISMRAAVHEALRLWLQSRAQAPTSRSILRDVGVVSGKGMTAEASSMSWEQLRAMSYDQNL